MSEPLTPSAAMALALTSLPSYLQPLGVYNHILSAAKNLQSPTQAEVIIGLLGSAAYYGVTLPDPTPGLTFPYDHQFHLKQSNEWYRLTANMLAADGVTQVSVMVSFEAMRMFGEEVQDQAFWSDDEDCHVVSVVANAVVVNGTEKRYARRNPNVNWKVGGDPVIFPDITQPTFVLQFGPDSLNGEWLNVLPLQLQVADGENLTINLTFSPAEGIDPTQAFFRQGTDGVTPNQSGIYYSWPQVAVSGTVQCVGQSFDVTGIGWIDHQLMLSPVPPAPVSPPGPLPTPTPRRVYPNGFFGWHWCQFNLSNGDAYTAVAFQHGPFSLNPPSPYGFYVHRQGSGWYAEPVEGSFAMDNLILVIDDVLQPTNWTYAAQSADVDVNLVAAYWSEDGSFHNADLTIGSEVAANIVLTGTITKGGPSMQLQGAGYCETIGAEPASPFIRRALAFLEGAPPQR